MQPTTPPTFTGAMRFTVEAILFDLDGTLIDSTIATERVWTDWSRTMGLKDYRHTAHGLPARSLVASLIEESRQDEALELINRMEIQDTDGICIKDGVAQLLETLPASRWTIVTSCTRELAAARMRAAGLHTPEHMVTADQVSAGKPNPEGFEVAAHRLGVDVSRCLVVEDAPVGLTAGSASGARTLGVTGTYAASQLTADAVVPSLARLSVTPGPDGSLHVDILEN